MASIIDDTEAIARRMREIAREEAGVDPGWNTFVQIAPGAALDDLAVLYGIEPRRYGESDASLRQRFLDRFSLDRFRTTRPAEQVV